MRVAILRSTAQSSISMKVYADNIVEGLKKVHPDWEILDISPEISSKLSLPGKRTGAIRNGLSRYYERYWRYPRFFKSLEADIFHVVDHSDGHLVSWLKYYGKSTLVTCHDLINWVQPEMYKGLAILPFISLNTWRWSVKQMKQADHIIAVSEHTALDVTRCLQVTPEKITAIPNAVSEHFSPASSQEVEQFRQQQGLSAETLSLLNIGSNNPRKNVSAILKTVRRLISHQQPVHFWKAGSDFTAEQQAFIKIHQLDAHVSYVGRIDDEQLKQLYSAADVLLAPSLYEGFGLTVLEAMACGTPVITADRTSLPEVAGDAAILVDPEDEGAITAAIEKLIQNPDLRNQLSQAGLARVQLFTWTNTAHKIASVYEYVYSLAH
ncbi:MAG: glycosyltransferase family 1 protein [Cyanobacteria bacterium J06634_5]